MSQRTTTTTTPTPTTTTTVYVRGITKHATVEHLRATFGAGSPIQKIDWPEKKPFLWITYATNDAAAHAARRPAVLGPLGRPGALPWPCRRRRRQLLLAMAPRPTMHMCTVTLISIATRTGLRIRPRRGQGYAPRRPCRNA